MLQASGEFKLGDPFELQALRRRIIDGRLIAAIAIGIDSREAIILCVQVTEGEVGGKRVREHRHGFHFNTRDGRFGGVAEHLGYLGNAVH